MNEQPKDEIAELLARYGQQGLSEEHKPHKLEERLNAIVADEQKRGLEGKDQYRKPMSPDAIQAAKASAKSGLDRI